MLGVRANRAASCHLTCAVKCVHTCLGQVSEAPVGGLCVCVRVLLVLRRGCHSITESRPSAAVMCSWAAPLCCRLHSGSPAIEELRPDPDAASRAMKTLAGGHASCHLNHLLRPHVTPEVPPPPHLRSSSASLPVPRNDDQQRSAA